MKKLVIALSAATMALGLRAAPSVAAEDFNGKTLDQLTKWSDLGESTISSEAATVNGSYGRPSYHVNAKTAVGENLAIKTALSTPAKYAFSDDGVDMGTAYVEALVKFTPTDEDITLEADSPAKIVFWTKEIDDGAGVKSTNLMITAGSWDGEALSPRIYDCGRITDFNGWLEDGKDFGRVSIKSIADIGTETGLSGFVVAVNGRVVTAATDLGTLPPLNTQASLWRNRKALFLSLKKDAAKINGLRFGGEGAVDDVAIDATKPTKADGTDAFLDEPAGFTMQVVENAKGQYKIGDGEWIDYTGLVTFAPGTQVWWQYVANKGYYFANSTLGNMQLASGDNPVASTTEKTAICPAKIGETYYNSLAEAAAAVQNGETIVLQDNVTLTTGVTFGNGIADAVLDLNGKTIAYDDTDTGKYMMTIGANDTLVITNGTMTSTVRGINVAGNLTLASGTTLNTACRSLNVLGVDNNWDVGTETGNPAVVTIAAGAMVKHGTGDSVAIFVRGSATGTRDFCNAKAILNVYGTVIDDCADDASWGITTNGGNATLAEVNFYEGSVYTSASWIIRLTQADLNLYGGTLTSAKKAIVLNCGTLNVPSDSKVKVVASGECAIVLERNNSTYPRNQYPELPIYQKAEIVANIAGGEFTSAGATISSTALIDAKTPVAEFVSGGYFSNAIDTGVVEEGYKAVASATKEGYYEIGADAIAGTGTAEDPWIIDSRRHLKAFRNGVNDGTYATTGAFIQQTADIDLRGETWLDIGNINDSDTVAFPKKLPFKGNYDGQNHVISNFFLSGKSYCGLFGAVVGTAENPASVKNLSILDAKSLAGASAISIAFGDVEGCVTFDNVTVSGNIEGAHNVGGFAAWLQDTVAFLNCTNLANCTTHRAKVGGFSPYYGGTAGKGSLLFENCCNKGTITMAKNISGDATYAVGGILAHAQSTAPVTFTDCFNEGAIIGTMEAAGVDKLGNLVETNFYGTADLGGIMGHVSGELAATFTNCVNSGAISADVSLSTNQNAAVGGILGAANAVKSTIGIVGCTVTADTALTATVAEKKNVYIGSILAWNNSMSCTVRDISAPTAYAAIGANKGKIYVYDMALAQALFATKGTLVAACDLGKATEALYFPQDTIVTIGEDTFDLSGTSPSGNKLATTPWTITVPSDKIANYIVSEVSHGKKITVNGNLNFGGKLLNWGKDYSETSLTVNGTLTIYTTGAKLERDAFIRATTIVNGALITTDAEGFVVVSETDGDYTKYVLQAKPAGFKVILTWSDKNVKSVTYQIVGMTGFNDYTSGQELTIDNGSSVQFNAQLTDWYKAVWSTGSGVYSAAAEVTLTAQKVSTADVTDPAKTVEEVAAEAGVAPAVVDNLAPAGADDADKKAALNKAMTWAQNNGKTTKEVAELNFTSPDQTTEAYLFNVADTEDAVKTAEEGFRFWSITPGTVPTATTTVTPNGHIKVQGKINLDAETWLNEEDAGYGDAKFYRAILTK